MISLSWLSSGNSDDMTTSQDPLAWQRQFEGDSERGKERKAEEETTSKKGQEWGLDVSLRPAEDREISKCIVATSSVVPWRPSRLRD